MAQRVQIILEDDFDGGVAEETVYFGLDGTDYEIDLSAFNSQALRDAMAPWLGHARKVTGSSRNSGGGRRKRSSSAPAVSSGTGSTSDVRAWAQAAGYEVSSRGRVSAEIRQAYDKANPA